MDTRTEFGSDVYTDINDIPDADWAELSRESSVYATKQWYHTTDYHRSMRPFYIAVRDASGSLRGVLRAFLATEPVSHFYDPAAIFAAVLDGPASVGWWPLITVGSRISTNELLIAPSLSAAGRRSVLAELARRLIDLQAEHGARAIAALYLPGGQAAELQSALGARAIALRSGNSSEIDTRWPSFEHYLKSLPSARRTSVRREIRRFAEAGHDVTSTTLDAVYPEIVPLVCAVDRKHGVSISARDRDVELAREADLLGGRSVVQLCRDRAGDLVGCAVFFQHDTALYARHVGFDYRLATSFEYFNLLFYRPIQEAIGAGTHKIHYGLATTAKLARGARTRPAGSVLWRPDWSVAELRQGIADWNARDQSLGLR